MPAERDKRDKAYQPCYFTDDQPDQHGFARHQSRATAFQVCLADFMSTIRDV